MNQAFVAACTDYSVKEDAINSVLACPQCPHGCANPLTCTCDVGCVKGCGSYKARYRIFPTGMQWYCDKCVPGVLLMGRDIYDGVSNDLDLMKSKQTAVSMIGRHNNQAVAIMGFALTSGMINLQ